MCKHLRSFIPKFPRWPSHIFPYHQGLISCPLLVFSKPVLGGADSLDKPQQTYSHRKSLSSDPCQMPPMFCFKSWGVGGNPDTQLLFLFVKDVTGCDISCARSLQWVENAGLWQCVNDALAMCLRCLTFATKSWSLGSSWVVLRSLWKFESCNSLRAGGGATLGHWVQHGKDQGWVPLSADKKADGECKG